MQKALKRETGVENGANVTAELNDRNSREKVKREKMPNLHEPTKLKRVIAVTNLPRGKYS